ncbi:MAG: MazG nucleotide pyrophosphohydrolase domain-containing protein [Dehalococcoidia bacterium]|nr:MazG nucleotide pyrophosphohydrolase domain-containing protein [Dehalococcoidia bacterium]
MSTLAERRVTMLRHLIQDVLDERARQDAKWGHPTERAISLGTWQVVLVEEVGEVSRAILHRDRDNLRDELIQVAAVALAMAEAGHQLARFLDHDEGAVE